MKEPLRLFRSMPAICGLLALVVAPPVRADGPPPLQFADIAAQIDEHPLLKAKQGEIAAAKAGVDAVGVAPNPTLSAQAAYGRVREGDDAAVEWGLSLSMPFGWLPARSAEKQVARAAVTRAEADAATLRQGLLLSAGALYWEVAYRTARRDAARALEAETDTLAATIRTRVDEGDVRPVEGIRIAVEVEKLRGETERAEKELAAAGVALSAWLGADPPRPVAVAAELDRLPNVPSREAAVDAVVAAYPDLSVAEAQVAQFSAERTLEKRLRRPEVGVELFTDHELDKRSSGGGVAVELPLWQWNRGGIARAEARLSSGNQMVSGVRRAAVVEALGAHASCEVRVAAARRFKERIVPRAEVAARMVERTYALGEAPLIDVIDARRTLIALRSEYLEVLAEAQTACGRLAVLMGREVSK